MGHKGLSLWSKHCFPPSSFLKTLRDGKEKQWWVVHYNKSRSGLTHILMLRASPLAGPWGGPRPPPPPGRGLSLALLWFRWCSHRPAHMWGWRKQTVEGWSSASPAHTLAAHAASLCPGPCTHKMMSLYTRRIIIISSALTIKGVRQNDSLCFYRDTNSVCIFGSHPSFYFMIRSFRLHIVCR